MNREEQIRQQHDALVAIATHHYVMVHWGTGVGKSRVAVKTFDALERRGKKRLLLLVQETAHKMNWKNEFTEALGQERGEELFGRIAVECYASFPKYENTSWDVIVADEAHHLRSEARVKVLRTLSSSYFVCLSATMSDNGDGDMLLDALRETFGQFIWKTIGLQEAIDKKILSEPEIYVHKLQLDHTKWDKTFTIEWGIPWHRKKMTRTVEDVRKGWDTTYTNLRVYPDLSLTITGCTDKQIGYFLDCQVKIREEKKKDAYNNYFQFIRYNDRESKEAKNLLKIAENLKFQHLQAGMQRKKFYGEYKTEFAGKLLESLGDKKFICFCSDIEQGEHLNASNIIHSGKTKKENMSIINGFNNGDIRSIFAVGMIKEGQNLAGIQAGVIIQLSGKERDFIQMFGRALRSQTPEQHIIVIDKSHDLDYLDTALGKVSSQYLHFINHS